MRSNPFAVVLLDLMYGNNDNDNAPAAAGSLGLGFSGGSGGGGGGGGASNDEKHFLLHLLTSQVGEREGARGEGRGKGVCAWEKKGKVRI